MRQRYPHRSVEMLCGLFGKSRNAFYDHQRRTTAQALLEGLVLNLVAGIRTQLSQLGTRKLLALLQPHLGEHAARVGRDYLFQLLARRPNLITHLTVSQAEQVWVSDITYVRLLSGWSYLSLITDLYSRKIVGACLHPDLSVQGTLSALQQALASRHYPHRALIHHSDRGLQYAAREYVGLLEAQGIALSMTQHGDPYENAVAERVNGILKAEFGLADTLPSFAVASSQVAAAVHAYNELRPHSSCDFLTPSQAHDQEGSLRRRWKSYCQPLPAPT